MKLAIFSLTLFFSIVDTLLANISSIENNSPYSLFFSLQDTTFDDSILTVTVSSVSQSKPKSLSKAMLYSAVIPGLGQTYIGKWKRGLLYLALEGVAAGFQYLQNVKAENRKKEYQSYAGDNWNFSRWILDYYKWYPSNHPVDTWFPGDQSEWEGIREVFVNNTAEGCETSPYCYIDIWDHSHSIKFYWGIDDRKLISSANEENFKLIYLELCGITPDFSGAVDDPMCQNGLIDIQNMSIEKDVNVINDHHFYEGIQKYDMFFAGWEDNEVIEVINSGNNVTSPKQTYYQNIYSDYNSIKKIARRGGEFMLVNHFISMIDALFLTKKWNTEYALKFNLNVYPDLRNKSGVGRVNLTMGWR